MNTKRPRVETSPGTRRALGSVDEVSEYLGVPVATLYVWRHRGIGPRSSRIGRYIRYRWSDVDAYVDQQASEVA